MKPIRHKFNAIRTEVSGIKFASKKESVYFSNLLLRQKMGEVIFFLRQCPLHMPGGAKYVCDFVEFWADSTVHFVDVKGMRTPTYLLKKRMIESLYPIEIEEK